MAKQRRIGFVLLLTAGLMTMGLVVEAAARGRVHRSGRARTYHGFGGFEFVFEGGMALPMGDQGDDLDFLGPGKGAETGYEIGFRFRQFLTPRLAISPAFHYLDFGKTSGVGDFLEEDALGFEVETSLMRYGVDFQYFFAPAGAAEIQPYFTGGIALIHNRYRDELEFYGPYEASTITPAASLGLGFQAGSFEMSGVYTFNRFSNNEMSSVLYDVDYNWDYLSVRLGLAFGGR